jgi:hypothetical protein
VKKRQAVSLNKNKKHTIKIKDQLRDAESGPVIQGSPFAHPMRPINSADRHTPTTSQILMRSSVKKPSPSLKRRVKISESTDKLLSKIPTAKMSTHVTLSTDHHERQHRAATLKRSEHIKHFVAPSENHAPKPANPANKSWHPAPQTTPTALPKGPTDLLLERALSQATSHEEPLGAPLRNPRWQRISLIAVPVAVLALLVISAHGFTRLQLRIASAKAGFDTSLPAYQPAGYSLGPLSYSSGIFSSEFDAQGRGLSYTITQKSTTWNTHELLNNYVMVNASNAKVIQIGNRTIYLYGDGDATWISGGIWYQLDSDGSLNQAQIIDVANSL